MSEYEVLAIIGGLVLGYVIVYAVMKAAKDVTSENTESDKSAGASGKKTEDSNAHQQNTYKSEAAKEEKHISARWFQILEVPETATMSVITSQYKRKMSEYHPDKVAVLGRELKELAERKTKEINLAYDYAKKMKAI